MIIDLGVNNGEENVIVTMAHVDLVNMIDLDSISGTMEHLMMGTLTLPVVVSEDTLHDRLKGTSGSLMSPRQTPDTGLELNHLGQFLISIQSSELAAVTQSITCLLTMSRVPNMRLFTHGTRTKLRLLLLDHLRKVAGARRRRFGGLLVGDGTGGGSSIDLDSLRS